MKDVLKGIFLVMTIALLIGANLLQFSNLPSSDTFQNGLICFGVWAILISLKNKD